MVAKAPPEPFLRRWSRRKLESAQEVPAPDANPITPSPATAPPQAVAPVGGVTPAAVAKPELPPVDALTFDSDFTAFLKPDVDPALKREALKKLFADPRFNVMDGLDVYIDDYTKFEPIPPDVVAQLNQARYLFDPPKTRVNEAGHVEDVPDEPVPAAIADEEPRAAELGQTALAPSLEGESGATPSVERRNDEG